MGQTSETPVCDVVNIKNRIRDTVVPQYPLFIIDYKQDEAQKHGPDVPLLCVFVHYASEGGAGAGAGAKDVRIQEFILTTRSCKK